MIRKQKEEIVAELTKVFTEAKGVYLADFTGINVETVNGFRQRLRKENVDYRVVKNTLTRRSLEGLPLDELRHYLAGPTGLIYSYDDALMPGKLINEFQKEKKLLPLKAAIIEGAVYDKSDAGKIILLPSRDELISKLLGSLNSPITGMVMVLAGTLRNLVGVLGAIRAKKESASADAQERAKPDVAGATPEANKNEPLPGNGDSPDSAEKSASGEKTAEAGGDAGADESGSAEQN